MLRAGKTQIVKKNKMNVLILGASSDIGLEVTKIFLDKGFEVTAHCYKNKKIFKKFNNYKKINYINFNLKNSQLFEKYLNKNINKIKTFDIFISLTGFIKIKKFYRFTSEEILDHLRVNYISNILVIQRLLKNMKKKNWGRILLSSSIGTKFGGGELTYAYSISKYLNEFFPSEYKKYYKYNISINSLQIGVTNTKIHKNNKKKNLKKRISLIPIKRMATTAEVADYIYFLCSKENRLITNQNINISGGE